MAGGSHASFSPDGAWLAYHAARSGRTEVYIQNSSDGAEKKVSEAGGFAPTWSGSANEIFYQWNGAMWVVPFTMESGITLGAPETLFSGGRDLGDPGVNHLPSYDMHSDGELFLFARYTTIRRDQVQVVTNFFEELERMVPTGR